MEQIQLTAWVREAAAGDRQAFVRLTEACRQTLYATAMAVTHHEDDALDAIQETLLTLWEKLGTLRNPAHFKTWMIRILVNNCCRLLREKRREMPFDLWEEPASENDPDLSLDVRRALERLTEGDRLILQLYYFEDFSVKEIARALSVSPGTVRMRLTRGRRRFETVFGTEVRHEKA